MPGPMESSRRKNQDRRIDKQREYERPARIDGCKFDSFASAFRCLLEFPRLHDRRMQIQVVRHHGGSKDADADVKHGLEKISSSAKQVPITAINVMTSAST